MRSFSHRRRTQQAGFTLIELMIVVAIIGILAAIAIPNFLKFQLRSKASEGRINLAGIRTTQMSYFSEVGFYVAWAPTPAVVPGSFRAPFAAVPCNVPPIPGDPGHCFVGFQPEGDVFFQYASITNGAVPLSGAQLFANARSDIDGDLVNNVWGFNVPDNAGASLPGGSFGCVNVVNPITLAPVLSEVGPCDNAAFGRTVF